MRLFYCPKNARVFLPFFDAETAGGLAAQGLWLVQIAVKHPVFRASNIAPCIAL